MISVAPERDPLTLLGTEPTDRPAITLLPGRSGRLRRGGPWIYSNEIKMDAAAKTLAPGSIVDIRDAGGEALGVAGFHPNSLIAGRMLSRDPGTAITPAFLLGRMQNASAMRDALFGPNAAYCRMVHGEADGLPGLIIDRFGPHFVVQTNSAVMDRLSPWITQGLVEGFFADSVIYANHGTARNAEGLPLGQNIAHGDPPSPCPVMENGVHYYADPIGGQKTGWFYDQRLNRAFIAGLCTDKTVLDLFSYAGGFGLAALTIGRARSVVAVDRAAEGLALASTVVLEHYRERQAAWSTESIDGFNLLQGYARVNRRFDVVICDPPAFTKSRKDLSAAAKGYRKLARMAAEVVAPSGFLFLASCSHHISRERFFEECCKGIGKTGRASRLIHSGQAGPDHPVHPLLPESAYLKSLTFALA